MVIYWQTILLICFCYTGIYIIFEINLFAVDLAILYIFKNFYKSKNIK